MIISDKFVFIHNPRTGGAFIKTMFKEILPIEDFRPLEEYHLPVSAIPAAHRDKLKFGMVRNPWAWYVSLYHFQQPNGKWLSMCLKNKERTFKNFLKTFLSSDFAEENKNKLFHPVGNPKAPADVPKFKYIKDLDIGFFTYRYIYLFFNDYQDIFSQKLHMNHDKLISTNHILKTEKVPHNIIKLLSNKIVIPNKTINTWKSMPKKNHTKHRDYKSYYDKELIELVRYKDRLIIDKYGYEF